MEAEEKYVAQEEEQEEEQEQEQEQELAPLREPDHAADVNIQNHDSARRCSIIGKRERKEYQKIG
ncbi:hypothetical protein TWF694_000075 [Orbilia ellipsospora]|uniref:Uncharacterized protein n=1 Tax=Orbilia ellipsospora TaxID=2528407 RepID=A0AAV9XQX3_9PEZI